MNYQPDIGFIDTHAKGIGSNHDPGFRLGPAFLAECTDFMFQAGMVIICRNVILFQEGGNFAAFLTVPDINNATSLGLLNQFEQVLLFVLRTPDHICQVFPLEALLQNMFRAKKQLFLDIFRHDRRGSCCEGKDRHLRKNFT